MDLEKRRKALEACGWTYHGRCTLDIKAHHPECKCGPRRSDWALCGCFIGPYTECTSPCSHESIHLECGDGPAIESDDGVALKFLQEFRAADKCHDWQLHSTKTGVICVLLFDDSNNGDEVNVNGVTVADAICNALIEAGKVNHD